MQNNNQNNFSSALSNLARSSWNFFIEIGAKLKNEHANTAALEVSYPNTKTVHNKISAKLILDDEHVSENEDDVHNDGILDEFRHNIQTTIKNHRNCPGLGLQMLSTMGAEREGVKMVTSRTIIHTSAKPLKKRIESRHNAEKATKEAKIQQYLDSKYKRNNPAFEVYTLKDITLDSAIDGRQQI